MKRILVTGGAGFIGSHLVAKLVALGHAVTVVDDLSTGRLDNLDGVEDGDGATMPGYEFFQQEMGNDESLRYQLDGHFDEVYILACPASPRAYQADPIKTLRACTAGTADALEFAHERGARVLLASTSEIYGDPLEHPQVESYNGNVSTTGPRSCYDEGKRAAEALCAAYERHSRMQVRIARIFNTYGPRMAADDGRVVSNFIVQALSGKPLTVYGDGSQTRSLCYVDDLVHGLIRLMESAVLGPVNLGNPQEFAISSIARMIAGLAGSRVPIAHQPLPGHDPRRRRPNIERARLLLGWEPHIDFDTGIRRTIDYFRATLAKA